MHIKRANEGQIQINLFLNFLIIVKLLGPFPESSSADRLDLLIKISEDELKNSKTSEKVLDIIFCFLNIFSLILKLYRDILIISN